MRPTSDQLEKDRANKAFNLTLAAVAGQVGCLTIVVVLAALFAGLYLDNRFGGDQPIFKSGLMLASIPVTLVAMFWVVRKATSRLTQDTTEDSENTEEEANSE
jgi:MFS-type transporter involved in bile tolerance (Atg22 family)